MNDYQIPYICGIVLSIFLVCVSSCSVAVNYQDNNAMTEMVNHGVDPLDALCAIKGSTNDVCLVRSARK